MIHNNDLLNKAYKNSTYIDLLKTGQKMNLRTISLLILVQVIQGSNWIFGYFWRECGLVFGKPRHTCAVFLDPTDCSAGNWAKSVGIPDFHGRKYKLPTNRKYYQTDAVVKRGCILIMYSEPTCIGKYSKFLANATDELVVSKIVSKKEVIECVRCTCPSILQQ